MTKTSRNITEVVAALVRREGRVLICRRPAHKARGLLWEFPGGKVEPGEAPREALVRECREELGVTLEVGELYMRVVHEYTDITVGLGLYEARVPEGEPQALEHAEIRWALPGELGEYAFCPADTEIVARLAAESGGSI
ncbi:MAG TPA: (deoxy)nucleoside triphosphate pyrophosphohydrolase [Candidatus Limnocylindria bacterium]|nr:(deoxy)nucleoside triphosphate pyrophosphohydrolase [Candidatus Limnocylindria bacterium]